MIKTACVATLFNQDPAVTALPPDLPPIDLDVLPDLTGCDDAMTRVFLADFVPVLQQERLALAAAGSQLPAIEAVAHRIKSAARYVGAMALGEVSEHLEQAAVAGDGLACGALLPAWHRACDSAEAFICAWLAEAEAEADDPA
jgi:two-component system sensor histidine kinase/response regulator